MLPPLILLSVLLQNNVISPAIPNLAITVNCLLRIQHVQSIVSCTRLTRWLEIDHIYHDIPLEEEEDNKGHQLPHQNIRFSSWSNRETYDFTSFTKNQLLRIYHNFGLAQLAAQNNGFIRVQNRRTVTLFHPEELFLFFMSKCKTGDTNKRLCKTVFGRHASCWSRGYPWILRYLDGRYEDIVGHQGLVRFVDQFPDFYNSIQEHVRKTSTHHFNDGTAADYTGLRFLPYNIFGFIDCSIGRINRPYSGPDGDYIGAPRKEKYDIAQRSVYTGYKKCHGIKVETVMLPNGISTVYSPTSARIHDLSGVLQMSGVDQFLVKIQQGRAHIYSAMGDGAYNANGLQCELISIVFYLFLSFMLDTLSSYSHSVISYVLLKMSVLSRTSYDTSTTAL